MDKNTLLNIYGAKLSKDGKRIVITLVSGDGATKKFYTACAPIEMSPKNKYGCDILETEQGKYAMVYIKFLADNNEDEDLKAIKDLELKKQPLPF